MSRIYKPPVNYRPFISPTTTPETIMVSGGVALLAEAPADPNQPVTPMEVRIDGALRNRVTSAPGIGEYKVLSQSIVDGSGVTRTEYLPVLQFNAADEGKAGTASYYRTGTVVTAEFYDTLRWYLTPLIGFETIDGLNTVHPATTDITRRGYPGDTAFLSDGSFCFSDGSIWRVAAGAGASPGAWIGNIAYASLFGYTPDAVARHVGGTAFGSTVGFSGNAIARHVGGATFTSNFGVTGNAVARHIAAMALGHTLGFDSNASFVGAGSISVSQVMSAAIGFAADAISRHYGSINVNVVANMVANAVARHVGGTAFGSTVGFTGNAVFFGGDTTAPIIHTFTAGTPTGTDIPVTFDATDATGPTLFCLKAVAANAAAPTFSAGDDWQLADYWISGTGLTGITESSDIYAAAKSNDGTISAVSSKVAVFVDTTAPTVTAFSITPSTDTDANLTGIAFTTDEAFTGWMIVDVAAGAAAPSQPTAAAVAAAHTVAATTSLTGQTHTAGAANNRDLYLFVRDAAGNVNSVANATARKVTVTISAAPTPMLVTPNGVGTFGKTPSIPSGSTTGDVLFLVAAYNAASLAGWTKVAGSEGFSLFATPRSGATTPSLTAEGQIAAFRNVSTLPLNGEGAGKAFNDIGVVASTTNGVGPEAPGVAGAAGDLVLFATAGEAADDSDSSAAFFLTPPSSGPALTQAFANNINGFSGGTRARYVRLMYGIKSGAGTTANEAAQEGTTYYEYCSWGAVLATVKPA